MVKESTKTKLLLIGGGLIQACLLKQLSKADLAKFEMILFSSVPVIFYPEMAAGYLNGDYSEADISIDLMGLCREKGVHYMEERITEIDNIRQVVKTGDGRDFSYDIMVINPDENYQAIEGLLKYGVPIRLGDNLRRVKQYFAGRNTDRNVTIIGAGKLGIEVALSLRQMLNKLNKYPVLTIIEAAQSVLPGFDLKIKELVLDELKHNGIELLLGRRVVRITGDLLIFNDNQILDYGYLIWTLKPAVNPVIKESGLAVDQNGLMRLNSYLQSFDAPDIFGAGEGVIIGGLNNFALMTDPINQARLLLKNIKRYSGKNRLLKITPMKQSRPVLNLRPKCAVRVVRGMLFQGKHIWRKQKHRDLKFMRKFRV